jgi:hypothetical protein
MRGGLREVAKDGGDTFSIEAELGGRIVYQVEISIKGGSPVIADESLELASKDRDLTKPYLKQASYPPGTIIINSTPFIARLAGDAKVDKKIAKECQAAMDALGSCRFLDLDPDAMRLPSVPGQVILGDRGDNLSSVLQALCTDESKEAALLDWVRQLTPMDVTGFRFPADQAGRVLLTLVEADGRRTTAYSASDGTLRLLAILAALFGPEPARFYFLEELENGIHPNRLALLVELLESVTSQGRTQVVATTHSPQLLRLLSQKTLENASVVYRLPGSNVGRIKRIIDLPHIREVLEKQDLARLHESGWLEDILNFSETPALV